MKRLFPKTHSPVEVTTSPKATSIDTETGAAEALESVQPATAEEHASRLEQSWETCQALFGSAYDLTALVGEPGAVLHWSPSLEPLVRRIQTEGDTLRLWDLFHVSDGQLLRHRLGEAQERGSATVEARLKRPAGGVAPVTIVMRRAKLMSEDLVVCTGFAAGRRAEHEQATDLPLLRDTLTGLPSRWLFQDRLEQSINSARRQQKSVAVVVIDLDAFNAANDHFSLAAGDVLLNRVATRIGGCLRESDTLARVGGDEFALLLESLNDKSDAEVVVNKVMDAITGLYDLGAGQFELFCSSGIALYPYDADSAATLLAQAYEAVAEVKAAGGNSYRFYASV